MTIYHWLAVCIVVIALLVCIAIYGLGKAEEQDHTLDPDLRETTPQPWWACYDRFERWVLGPAACAVIGAVLVFLGPTLDRSDAERDAARMAAAAESRQ